MSEYSSPYYPPRAHWYSPFLRPWYRLRRLRWVQSILDVQWGLLRNLFPTFLLPGYSFRLAGHFVTAKVCQYSYLGLGLVFLIALGYGVANVAMGLMIGIHTASALFGLGSSLGQIGYRRRIALALSVMVLLCLLIYLPVRNWITEEFLVPLRCKGNVVIVNRLADIRAVRRGAIVAYKTPDFSPAHGYRVDAGYGFDPVATVAGDRVRFTKFGMVVSGQLFPKQPYMPASGELIVTEGQLYVCHSMRTWRAPIAYPDAVLRDTALVDESRFVGKAFEYWFWRKQTLQ